MHLRKELTVSLKLFNAKDLTGLEVVVPHWHRCVDCMLVIIIDFYSLRFDSIFTVSIKTGNTLPSGCWLLYRTARLWDAVVSSLLTTTMMLLWLTIENGSSFSLLLTKSRTILTLYNNPSMWCAVQKIVQKFRIKLKLKECHLVIAIHPLLHECPQTSFLSMLFF